MPDEPHLVHPPKQRPDLTGLTDVVGGEVVLTQVGIEAIINPLVIAAIEGLVDAAPGSLNTLNEIAAAMNDDPAFAATINTALGIQAANIAANAAAILTKAPLVSQFHPTAVKTADYAAVPGDFVPINTTSQAVVISLPNNPDDGTVVAGKRIAGPTNNASFVCTGADVFNVAGGSTTATMSILNMQYNFVYHKALHVWYVETNFSKTGLDGLYSGKLLGSAINTSDTSLGASTTAKSLDGGGLSVPVTVGTKPIKVGWGGNVQHTVAGQIPSLGLYEDGVKIDGTFSSISTASGFAQHWKELTLTPSAAGHTYEVKLLQVAASATAHAYFSAAAPGRLIVQEV